MTRRSRSASTRHRTIDTTKETLEWLQKRMPRENES